ncbi:MAG: HdeA/HdeB family chaperone [Rhizobiaceae bacterium]
MKKFLAATALAAFALGTAAPAKADAVDMSTITCGQLLQMKQDEISFVLIWVAGYMAGTEEETSMDPAALGAHVTATVTYCGQNAEMSVLNAAKESAPKG